jgi:hypothetical protein
MLRIVTPVTASTVPTADVGAVSAIDVGAVPSINIGVAIEVIKVVNGNVVPAPTAAISPAASPKRAHRHTNTE